MLDLQMGKLGSEFTRREARRSRRFSALMYQYFEQREALREFLEKLKRNRRYLNSIRFQL